MISRKIFGIAFTITCLIASSQQQARGNGFAGNMSIPGEALFKLELLSPINTATNRKGDSFDCRVLEPREFYGSIVSGQIARLKRSGKVEGQSELALTFGLITYPAGGKENFGAQVVEVYDVTGVGNQGRADDEGSVRAKSIKKRDALKVAAGSVVGAILGGILGGGKGAAIGAAIGAAFGASTVIATKGPDLEFKQGTQFVVKTDKRQKRD